MKAPQDGIVARRRVPADRAPAAGAARRSALVALALAVATSACGVGTGTVRIVEAEDVIVAVAEGIADALELAVTRPIVPENREPCQLRTGEAGLRSRISLRAPSPDAERSFNAAASVLVAEGLVVVESGVPDTMLGQRDGISVTVTSDGQFVQLDALTGCRPR
jgi:hypothetical protein